MVPDISSFIGEVFPAHWQFPEFRGSQVEVGTQRDQCWGECLGYVVEFGQGKVHHFRLRKFG